MNSSAANSRIASRRSQSITWRCTSGSGTRRRSGRGGKRPAGTTTPAPLRPLMPLLPDQGAVGPHHTDRMPMKPRPQPALVLVPAQQALGLLVVPLHPVPPVRVLDHRRQRHLRPEVTPVILRLPGLTTRASAHFLFDGKELTEPGSNPRKALISGVSTRRRSGRAANTVLPEQSPNRRENPRIRPCS